MMPCAKCGYDLSKLPHPPNFCPECLTPADSFLCANCQQVCALDLRDQLQPDQCVKCASAVRAEEMRWQATDRTNELKQLHDAQQKGLSEIDALRSELVSARQAMDAAAQSGGTQSVEAEQKATQALKLVTSLDAEIAGVEATRREQQEIARQMGLLEARLQQEQQRHRDVPDLSQDLDAVRRTQRELEANLHTVDQALRERVAELGQQQQALDEQVSKLGLRIDDLDHRQHAQEAWLHSLDAVKSVHAQRLAKLEDTSRQLQEAQHKGIGEIDALRSDLERARQAMDTAAESAELQQQKVIQALGLATTLEARLNDLQSTRREQQDIVVQLARLEAALVQEQQRHKDVPDLSQDVEAIRRTQSEIEANLLTVDQALRERVAELDQQQQALAKRLSDLGLQVNRIEQLQQTHQNRLQALDAVKSEHAQRLAELESISKQHADKMAEMDRVKAMTVDHVSEAARLRQQCQADLAALEQRQNRLLDDLEDSKTAQDAAVARVEALRREMEADAQLQSAARAQLEALNSQQEAKIAELDTVTQQAVERMREVEQQQAEMRRLSNEVAAHLDAIKEAAEAASHAREEFEQVKEEWLKTFGIIHSAIQSGQGIHLPAGAGITVDRPPAAAVNPEILQELARIRNASPAFAGRVWSDRESAAAAAQTRDINVVPTDSKAVYRAGECIALCFQSECDCYLTVIDVGTSGAMKIIFPNLWFPNNFLRAGQTHLIPQAGYPFRFEISGPRGIESVKAIFTLDPVDFASGGFSEQQPFKDISVIGSTRDINVVAAEVQEMSHRITDLPADRWCESTCEFFVDL